MCPTSQNSERRRHFVSRMLFAQKSYPESKRGGTLISEMDLFLRKGRNGDFFYEMELQNPNLISKIVFSCFNTRVSQYPVLNATFEATSSKIYV